MEVIGVDIGGTNIKLGVVSHGVIGKKCESKVDKTETEIQTLERLYKCIDNVISKNTRAIGIGVPGVVDTHNGTVYDLQNIPSWKEVPLATLLETRYKLPVFVNNDANCFIMGEKLFGKAQKYDNCIGLSIGTGLGMGILIEGNIYNGVMSGAGEIGMVSYKDGILEDYASSFFFSTYYNNTAKTLHDMAQQGDVLAFAAFAAFGEHIGSAINNILYLFAPQAIILGGSISSAFPFFEKSMYEKINQFAYPKQIENLKIERSTLVASPILGAASLCFQKHQNDHGPS